MRALLLIAPLFISSTLFAAKFEVDKAHTHISFSAPHLVISKVKGRFTEFNGTFDFDEKTQKLSNVMVTIQTDSINTEEADRDKHLKSADFFDVTKHPTITFKSTKVNYDKDKPEEIEGDLTIRGVTKKVKLEIDYNGAVTDPWGNRVVAFEAETEIDRKDYGFTWNKSLDKGGVVVGDKIKISIDGEAKVQAAKKK